VYADRLAAISLGYKVGLAEYFDLLEAVAEIAPNDYQQQAKLLKDLSCFALVKHKDQDQARESL
jgi:hypothetical protein